VGRQRRKMASGPSMQSPAACRRPSCGRVASLTDFQTSLQQKGRHFCRPSLREIRSRKRSVFGYDRGAGAPAEAVVDAQGDHIDVLADPIVEKSGTNRIDDRERVV
jgi:hypothetical protein